MPDIVAKLKKIIWRSIDNDFTIASFQTEGNNPEFVATGDLFKPSEGIIYSLSGEWQEHPKYGKQFKIDGYCVQAPVDSESIGIYLEKHVKGIGPVLADKLIEKYGNHTIKILKGAPERVSDENSGISYKLALDISEQLSEDDKRQDVLIKLEGILSKVKGIPKRLASDLMNVYGLTAYEVVKSNPYVLTGMHRIGFILADKVAMACGVKPDDPERIKAGIIYVIKQTMQETGDVWLAPESIYDGVSNLINRIKPDDIGNAFENLINTKVLTGHIRFATLTQFAEDEDLIADCVTRFLE
jgi:exodeoxyribonuclease V alpha subunit